MNVKTDRRPSLEEGLERKHKKTKSEQKLIISSTKPQTLVRKS